MDRTVKFGSTIQPGCLPDEHDPIRYDGALAIITGWGQIGELKKSSTLLRSLVIPIWSQSECFQSAYGEQRLTKNMMCAGFQNGVKDACLVIVLVFFFFFIYSEVICIM